MRQELECNTAHTRHQEHSVWNHAWRIDSLHQHWECAVVQRAAAERGVMSERDLLHCQTHELAER